MDTATVVGTILDQDNTPIENALVIIELDRYDQDISDKTYIIPTSAELKTDETGSFTQTLWKNSEGARSTSYTMKVYRPNDYGVNYKNAPVININFTIPAEATGEVNVFDIATIEPFPSKSEYQVALEVVQSEVLKAQDAATSASNDAAQVSDDKQVVVSSAQQVALDKQSVNDDKQTVADAAAQVADDKQAVSDARDTAVSAASTATSARDETASARDDAVSAASDAADARDTAVNARDEILTSGSAQPTADTLVKRTSTGQIKAADAVAPDDLVPLSQVVKYLQEYGVYDPSMLFLQGEQGAWYDPSDLSTLFQDSAGTTPVTGDGQPVGLMLDKSGNGNHATQSVAASRPTYRTDGTLHWLAFDGVDDCFDTGLEHQENWSAYISINLISSGIFFGGRGTSDTRWYLGNAFGVGDYFSTISLNTDNQVISLTTENFEYKIKSNLNSIVSGVYTGTTQPAINSLLFARNNVGNPDLFTGGLFYGCVARNPIEQDTRLIKYLANKAGVTL